MVHNIASAITSLNLPQMRAEPLIPAAPARASAAHDPRGAPDAFELRAAAKAYLRLCGEERTQGGLSGLYGVAMLTTASLAGAVSFGVLTIPVVGMAALSFGVAGAWNALAALQARDLKREISAGFSRVVDERAAVALVEALEPHDGSVPPEGGPGGQPRRAITRALP